MLILLGYGQTNKALAEKFAPCCIFDDSFTQISKDLTFIGFKKEVPYNITINKGAYAFGDPNQLASMVNEE